ncbi:SRPBCC family protein [Chengkuizengella marina]|uniref:SRPBCC domain-containing protein n=1 Tax=Chengkuizengella marina TaxID=2507566 RepID=A0A6N9Q1H9_9BACL|nr:SRPBCC domain-containing protein [Chengkuizengella marina]NBI27448.1 SRPBCC domain-containing protein [Chengkuizengella marina]
MTVHTETFINSSIELIWRAWTESDRITKWFAPAAEIQLKNYGKYELYFDPTNKNSMSTIGCKLLDYEEPSFLEFQWKGPDEFNDVMNDEKELTIVKISLLPYENGTKLILEHTGWGTTDGWIKAKNWHIKAWEQALSSLKSNMESGEGILSCN